MKYGRGKWVHGTFLLVARDAARRFAFDNGGATGRRSSWRPLILRWRQRRKRQEKPRTGRGANPARILWFPQFHFHYASYLRDRTRRDRVSGPPPAAEVPKTQALLDHHWPDVRAAELPRQPLRAHRPWRPFYARQGSRPKIDAEVKNRSGSSSPPRAHSIVPQATFRRPALLFGRMPEVGRAGTRRDERTQPFQTQSRIWQHWLPVFRVRQPTPGDRVPHRLAERQASQVKFDVPEELVWRRAKRPPTEVAEVEGAQATSDSFHGPAQPTIQSQEVVHLSPPSEPAAALQITKLDPSLLDRLADDVIRRVEKRARIERQRRGL